MDNAYEEMIRMEAEQMAIDEFGASYCDLSPSQRLQIRELVVEHLDAYEVPVESGSRAA